jgi:hypothetical protein
MYIFVKLFRTYTKHVFHEYALEEQLLEIEMVLNTSLLIQTILYINKTVFLNKIEF